MNDTQLGIVVTAVDRASAVMANVEASTKRLANTFDSFRGRVKNAFQFHVINRGLNLLERGLVSVARAIPDLIHKGQQWADVVDQVSDATGLSARRSSELAAIQSVVGGSTATLTRGLVILARNATTNQKAFDQLGVATRDSNGRMLDAYTIFQNLRERVSATGGSLLSTAAAQKVFGRGAGDLLDILSLTNGQWRILSEEARRSGLIMSEAGLRAAEAWQRTQNLLNQTITGLGAQVLQGAAPALTALANGVTQAIQRNMDNIVRFVVQAVNFVAGLIGGFLGVDMGMATVTDRVDRAGDSAQKAGGKVKGLTEANLANEKAAKGAASGQDRYARSLQRSIDAIDRQLAALDRTERKADSRRTQQQLLADIAQARGELADIRSDSIFASGMSEAEAELARQAQAGRIADGQKRVADAERRLRDERRQQEAQSQRDRLTDQRSELQRMLAAHQQAISKMNAATASAGRSIGASFRAGTKPLSDFAEKGLPKLSEGLKQAGKDAQAAGRKIADAVQDAIFGEDKQVQIGGGAPIVIRSGGLITHLQNLGKFLGDLAGLIGGSSGLISIIGGLAAALAGYKLFVAPMLSVAKAIASLLPVIGGGGGTPPTTTPGGGKAGGGKTSWLGSIIRGGTTGAALGTATERLRQGLEGTNLIEQAARSMGLTDKEILALTRANMKGGASAVRAQLDAIQKTRSNTGGPARPGRRSTMRPDPPPPVGNPIFPSLTGPGFGMNTRPLEAVFRRFWGSDSPIGRGQAEVTDATASGATYQAETAGNTTSLGEGRMGVSVNDWAKDLPAKVTGWAAGDMRIVNDYLKNTGTVYKWDANAKAYVKTDSGTKLQIKANKGDIPTGGGDGYSYNPKVELTKIRENTGGLRTHLFNKKGAADWLRSSDGHLDVIKGRLGSTGNVTGKLENIRQLLADIKKQGGGGSGGGRAAGGPVPAGWSGYIGETGREWLQMYPGGGGRVTSNANLPNVVRGSGSGGGPTTLVVQATFDRSAVREMMAGRQASSTLKPVS